MQAGKPLLSNRQIAEDLRRNSKSSILLSMIRQEMEQKKIPDDHRCFLIEINIELFEKPLTRPSRLPKWKLLYSSTLRLKPFDLS